MRLGGKTVGKGKGGHGNASQYAGYTSGAYSPAGQRHGKASSGQKHSGSKADRMYNKAMRHSV